MNPDFGVSNTMYFNGNDAITLEKGSDIIDIFGKVGENPGEAWGDENGAWWTKDQTLIRKSSVMGGFVYNQKSIHLTLALNGTSAYEHIH